MGRVSRRRRRASSAGCGRWPPRTAPSPRRAPAHADRPGRGRQDAPGPGGRPGGPAGAFPDGVRLADLAPLADPARCRRRRRALGRARGGRPAGRAHLLARLGRRRLLLVLDNCEHLVGAVAALAAALLPACPGLRLLATSREVLGVAGETAWPVRPLAHARRRARARPRRPRGAATRCACSSSGPRAAQAGLRASRPRTRRPVAQICRRLDGLPLALELAAARVRVLPVGQLSPGWTTASACSRAASRTAPPRQQTLRAVVDWSYDLLTRPGAGALRPAGRVRRRLDAGGAEAVGAGGGLARRSAGPADPLVDHSLVVAEAAGDGTTRYRLLETLREYARSGSRRGESGRAAAARRLLPGAGRSGRAARGPRPATWEPAVCWSG